MSFEKFMSEWAAGKRALDCGNAFYEIRPSNASLQESEILHQGTESVEETTLNREHLCWLRDRESKIRCCYWIENSFRELTFKQLDTLFGEEIRQGGIQKNEQVLANGITIPIVPESFIEEVRTKHDQKKRRVLYAQKIKKKNLKEINAMLCFFNMGCAPTDEECFESIHIIPPNLLRSKKTRDEEKVETSLRERTIAVLETTRNKIKNHPIYNSRLETSIFKDVHTVADLLKLSVEDDGNKINIAQQLVGMYHLLFPYNNS